MKRTEGREKRENSNAKDGNGYCDYSDDITLTETKPLNL